MSFPTPTKKNAVRLFVFLAMAIVLTLISLAARIFLQEYSAQGYGFAALAGSQAATRAFDQEEYYFLKIRGPRPSRSHPSDDTYEVKE
jgi:hypothetical protein